MPVGFPAKDMNNVGGRPALGSVIRQSCKEQLAIPRRRSST